MNNTLNIHRVTEIKVGEIVRKVNETSGPYYVREIMVCDDNGKDLTIYLFGTEFRSSLSIDGMDNVPASDGYAESMDGSAS